MLLTFNMVLKIVQHRTCLSRTLLLRSFSLNLIKFRNLT